MGDIPLTSLDHLIEQARSSLDPVLQSRVIIASNSIEMYSLFEYMRIVLIQIAKDNPKFLDVLTNENTEEESSGLAMESLLQEMNELIIKLDKFT